MEDFAYINIFRKKYRFMMFILQDNWETHTHTHSYDKINFCETVFFIRFNNFEKYIIFQFTK